MPEDDRRCPRSGPALSSRSRQPLGADRLRRGVDQVVEQGAVARDRDTVKPPLDEEVVQPFGVAFDDDVGVVDRACVRAGADDEAGIRDALAVLLPLEVSTENGGAADAWDPAQEQVSGELPDEIRRILAAARTSEA